MDIVNTTKEQKVAAAVTWLTSNKDESPEFVVKNVEKLININNDGMTLVSQIKKLRAKIDSIDNEIGQKIGGARVLFEVIGDLLTDEQIDEFAEKFTQKQSDATIASDIEGQNEKS